MWRQNDVLEDGVDEKKWSLWCYYDNHKIELNSSRWYRDLLWQVCVVPSFMHLHALLEKLWWHSAPLAGSVRSKKAKTDLVKVSSILHMSQFAWDFLKNFPFYGFLIWIVIPPPMICNGPHLISCQGNFNSWCYHNTSSQTPLMSPLELNQSCTKGKSPWRISFR